MSLPTTHEPEPTILTFVLVHGAFQTGDTWASVAAALRSRGHTVHTPTLAGHRAAAPMNLAHADAVDSLVGYLREHHLSEVRLVGHSIAGTFIAKAAEHVPNLIARLVFHNAFVAADGHSIAQEFPPEQAAMFAELDPIQGFLLPFQMWRERAANDLDLATAEQLYANMSPIPTAFVTDRLDLTTFYDLLGNGAIRTSWVNAVDDTVLPPGDNGWFPRFAHRLGPLCRILHCPGGHEAKTSRPTELAETLIRASRD